MLIAFVLSCACIYAQQTAQVGDITMLSVNEVSGDTYVWELYDVSEGVDFAKTAGNCPKSKARFVNGVRTGNTVNVEWLAEGEYFYKVTSQNSCTNNIKIGRILVLHTDIPPPDIGVLYDCKRGVAVLTAMNYTGKLLWSTGETKETIEVSEAGVYTLTQTVNGQESKGARTTIEQILPSAPSNVQAIPPEIEAGEIAELIAEGCENGTLHWYTDKNLTEELEYAKVSPGETTTYYVVCENDVGCKSEASAVQVRISTIDNIAKCEKMYRDIKVEQVVSPNGDGYNDTWELEDVLKYCKVCDKAVKVVLLNRWGAKVYEKYGYMLDEERFDGHSENGLDYRDSKLLPSGTYFYVITVKGERYKKTGYINIITSE